MPITYRLKGFRILNYSSAVEGKMEGAILSYTLGVSYRMIPEEGRAAVEIRLRVHPLNEPLTETNILGDITSQTGFEITEGMPAPDQDGSVVVPIDFLRSVVNLAIGTTRGALSVLSGGNFLCPIFDMGKILPTPEGGLERIPAETLSE